MFSSAKPKLAVYSHLVFLATDKVPRASVDDVVAGTRESYSGPLQTGTDLMSKSAIQSRCTSAIRKPSAWETELRNLRSQLSAIPGATITLPSSGNKSGFRAS